MTQISNPPAFPQVGTRSKTKAIAILTALIAALILGAAVVSKAHARAPRPSSQQSMEMTPPPPSYADALRQAEAEDLAKGVTPEMAAALRARGSVDTDTPKPVQAGQI